MEAATRTVVPTLRQERLAEALLDPNIKTKKAALLQAGYSENTATWNPGQSIVSIGTQLALERAERKRSDKARGLDRILALTINGADVEKRIASMEAGAQMMLGLQAMKLKADLGVEPEQGDGDMFRAWRRAFVNSIYPRLRRMETSVSARLGGVDH
jgi:hypothetical protein